MLMKVFAFLILAGGLNICCADFEQILGSPQANNPYERPPMVPMQLRFGAAGRLFVWRQNGDSELWDIGASKFSRLGNSKVFAVCDDGFVTGDESGLVVFKGFENSRPVSISSGGPHDYASMSADCQLLLLAGVDRPTELWQVQAVKRLRTFVTTLPVRNGAVIAANGKSVLLAEGVYQDGHQTLLSYWPVEAMTAQLALDERPEKIVGMWNIRLSRDGRYLATTTQHNSKSGALVMDVSTGKRIFETAGRTSYWIRGLDLSDSLLAIGDELGGVVVWDINSKAALLDTNVGQVVQSVAISPDNKTLAVGLWDATIGLLQIAK